MRKGHNNTHSFWHKELLAANFSWKRRDDKKRNKIPFVPEKNRTTVGRTAMTLPAEKKENPGRKSAVKRNIEKVYAFSGGNGGKSPLKISILSAKLRKITRAEYDPFSPGGTEKKFFTGKDGMEEKIYSLIRQYMKENLPDESI